MNWHIPERKIRSYLLNIDHREGGPKARFFHARGFSDAEWWVLAQALRQHPVDNPIAAQEETEFGQKYIIRCQLRTPDGRNPCIRTVWMAEEGPLPRFVTAYPAEP